MCNVLRTAKKRIIELDKAVQDKNFLDIVDIAADMQQAKNALDASLEKVKTLLREKAKADGTKTVEGMAYYAAITPSEERIIDPQGLQKQMVREQLGGRFWEFVTVKVGDVTKFLGEASLKRITTKVPKTPSVSFKEVK